MVITASEKRKREDDAFIKEVVAYYKQHGRHDLPWRKNITPYRILVSEVMLQQTQVIRVVPKFDVWMKQYESLGALAGATLGEVLILWQGLGYQRRAKALFEIAKKTKNVPKDFEELLRLPGIGKYTASAVCAFAYNIFSHPVLETNIRTALIEYLHQDKDTIHDGILYDDLSRLEQSSLVKKCGAREWYYALMDFGAYLKSKKISHNDKSAHHKKQTPFKGSHREVRAKVLFAIAHKTDLPKDERVTEILSDLCKEGFIVKKKSKYEIL